MNQGWLPLSGTKKSWNLAVLQNRLAILVDEPSARIVYNRAFAEFANCPAASASEEQSARRLFLSILTNELK
jgi:hypothetical protein